MFDIYIDRNKKYKVDDLYQWDTKVSLNIHGLNLVRAPEIHFSNTGLKEAIVKQSTMSIEGIISVQVPDTALQYAGNLDVYIYAYESDESRTLYQLTIKVIGRKKPADYIATDDEKIYSYNALENKLDNTVVELTRANDETLAEVDNKIATFELQIADSLVTIQGSAEAVASLLLHLEDKNNPHEVTYTQVGAPSATAFNDLSLYMDNSVKTHIADKNNPHNVTPALIGAPTTDAFNTLNTNATSHIANKSNPHGVTAEQLLALKANGYITDNGDIDNLADGIYYYNGWAYSSITCSAGLPFTSASGLWIKKTPYNTGNDSYRFDIAINSSTGKIYVMFGYSGAWIDITGNYLPLTGGTMSGMLFLGNAEGNEGGELIFAKPPDNANFTDNITLDICDNRFRIFTTGHNGLIKIFNIDFLDHKGFDAMIYHSHNVTCGTADLTAGTSALTTDSYYDCYK